MAATVPTILDDFRISGADVRFLMFEESSALFKINSLLLFSIDVSSDWFAYLQTHTHIVAFFVICIVSVIDVFFEIGVMSVGFDAFLIEGANVVGCCTVSGVVTCTQDTLLVGSILLAKWWETDQVSIDLLHLLRKQMSLK